MQTFLPKSKKGRGKSKKTSSAIEKSKHHIHTNTQHTYKLELKREILPTLIEQKKENLDKQLARDFTNSKNKKRILKKFCRLSKNT